MNDILFLDVIFLGDLQHVVESGTGIATYPYKLLFMRIFIETMVPSIPNMCPIYSDEFSTRYCQLVVTY